MCTYQRRDPTLVLFQITSLLLVTVAHEVIFQITEFAALIDSRVLAVAMASELSFLSSTHFGALFKSISARSLDSQIAFLQKSAAAKYSAS